MRDEGRRELTATTARRIQGSLMKTPPKRGMTPPTVKDTAEAIAACKGSHRCSRMSLQPVGRGFPSTAGMKPVQQGRPLTIVRYEVQSFACSDLPGICLLVEVFQVNAQLITCMGFNCLLLRYRQGPLPPAQSVVFRQCPESGSDSSAPSSTEPRNGPNPYMSLLQNGRGYISRMLALSGHESSC